MSLVTPMKKPAAEESSFGKKLLSDMWLAVVLSTVWWISPPNLNTSLIQLSKHPIYTNLTLAPTLCFLVTNSIGRLVVAASTTLFFCEPCLGRLGNQRQLFWNIVGRTFDKKLFFASHKFIGNVGNVYLAYIINPILMYTSLIVECK